MASPGCAALIAAWRSPPAGTLIVLPVGATKVELTVACGRCGAVAAAAGAIDDSGPTRASAANEASIRDRERLPGTGRTKSESIRIVDFSLLMLRRTHLPL